MLFEDIIRVMVKQINFYVEMYKFEMKKNKLFVYKLLMMVFLIEEEVIEKVDCYKIVSVFYNCLKEKMLF